MPSQDPTALTIASIQFRESVAPPTNFLELLSAARSHFLHTQSYNSGLMQLLTNRLSEIAVHVYGTKFTWSDYNKGQWSKFVTCQASDSPGGACMFSMEPDGIYNAQIRAIDFKGLYIGVPTGLCPYGVSAVDAKNAKKLRDTVMAMGYKLDCIGNPP